MGSEACFEERPVDGPGVVEEKLRLDTVDTGRVEEQFEEALQQGEIGLAGEFGVWCDGPCVTDNCFVALVDAKGVAADAASVKRDEAGKDARIEVLKKKVSGRAVVPAEAIFPLAGLGFEQGPKLAGGEVPQVEDLELGDDRHAQGVSVELIRYRGQPVGDLGGRLWRVRIGRQGWA